MVNLPKMLIVKKIRTIKKKFFIIPLTIIFVYILITHVFLEMWLVKRDKSKTLLPVDLPNVIVHIDLKGTPLKLSYLESLIPVLKKYGVNGILMEYEDMFPYEGRLVNLSAEYCYNKSELKKFLSMAAKEELQIIPLVQTFGHLEYALKLAEFQHLRELHVYPDSICPTRQESGSFLRHMIEQVIGLHTEVAPLKYIHIGCDEVFHINKCQLCKNRKLSKRELFLQHVKTVSGVVKSLSAETTVLIWDDMLRDIKPGQWNTMEPFFNVRPIYWDYSANLQVTHLNLLKYHKKFPDIWIASAYKGADGKTRTFPNLRERFMNHFSWMNLILGYTFGGEADVYKFKGIILTGWSRYCHMDPPCELLPVSIPSLILNLLVIEHFKKGIGDLKNNKGEAAIAVFKNHLDNDLNNIFNCMFSFDEFDYTKCRFEGAELFNILKQHKKALNSINGLINGEENSLNSVYFYSSVGTLNMNSVSHYKEQLELNLSEIFQLEDRISKAMSKYYNKEFALEYINCKSYETKKQIIKILKIFNAYMRKGTWQRRTYYNMSADEIYP